MNYRKAHHGRTGTAVAALLISLAVGASAPPAQARPIVCDYSVHLTPVSTTRFIGENHTITAIATRTCFEENKPGPPQPVAPASGLNVALTWSSGPNKPKTMQKATDQAGKANFVYSSSKAGTDTIVSDVVNAPGNATEASNFVDEAQATWVPPHITVNDVTVGEGDSGLSTAGFTASLNQASPVTVTAAFATSDGTAKSGPQNDYLAKVGTITFPPNTTSAPIPISVVGDQVDEQNETFKVKLSGATNAVIADSQGIGTILDDDLPQIAVSDVTVKEGNTGIAPATMANFTVSLSQPSPMTVTVAYATADGTATAGPQNDYLAKSGTVTFVPNDISETVSVPVVGDLADEPNKTFKVNLSGPTNAVIGDPQGIGTIVDDDRNGSFSCRASALRLDPPLPIEPVVANSAAAPCGAAGTTLLGLPVLVPGIALQALSVSTGQTPSDLTLPPAAGDNARADVAVASVSIASVPLIPIQATVLTAEARATCLSVGPQVPQLSSSSSVREVVVGTTKFPVGNMPTDLPVGNLATLHVNHRTTRFGVVVQRALWLDFPEGSLLGDVVLGEATAGFSGDPCTA